MIPRPALREQTHQCCGPCRDTSVARSIDRFPTKKSELSTGTCCRPKEGQHLPFPAPPTPTPPELMVAFWTRKRICLLVDAGLAGSSTYDDAIATQHGNDAVNTIEENVVGCVPRRLRQCAFGQSGCLGRMPEDQGEIAYFHCDSPPMQQEFLPIDFA